MARKEMKHRQVIVIGAGPAGSACAQRLAEEGLDVLMIERRSIVGNPAQCGECIPNWGEVVGTFSNLEDHTWLYDYFQFPDRLKLHNLDNMRVFLPSGKAYHFDLDAFAGHRLHFDGYLADKAIHAGAEVQMEEALTKIQHQSKADRDVVVTTKGRYTFDFLIDASGSLAHVGRLRHGDDETYRPKDQVPTMYAQVQGNVPETFDVFLGSVAPSGYAWIIPKGPNTANVGLGVRAGYLKGNLKEHLQEFCDELGFEILSWGGGWIPMGGPVKTMVDGSTLAVGDAAGLVMPSNGGGISQAIISGCFAAEAILDNLNKGTPLSAYETRLRASLGRALKNSLRTKNFGYAFFKGDLITESILRILGPIGGIKRAMECDKPVWLF
ncbi:MAG: NAD(P)/FAD-dependent oxidoreductase [Candidatus Poseidoniaceae archaeon]|jgi:digeranylgeranylglycerophospholipid reductase|tara:strand:- start:29042 stop:30187 length:1146 start_codon:yes stop_codon:yes gene_type:complete